MSASHASTLMCERLHTHAHTHTNTHARTHAHTHNTHTQLFYGPLGFCPGLPKWAGTRKVKPIWIYWSKRQWVAVASAGPYANLHLYPDTYPRQHPTTLLFTGWMPFLSSNRQRQNTESIGTADLRENKDQYQRQC